MRRWIVHALVLALSFTALAACGGDPNGDSGGGSADQGGDGDISSGTTAPADFMRGLCTAISSYQADLETQNAAFQDEFSSGTPTPAETKDALIGFLDDIKARTQQLIDEVEELGTPEIENGESVRSAMVGAFQNVVDLFVEAKADIEGLSTDDPAGLVQGFTQVGTKLQEAGADIQNSLADFESPELSEAAADADACAGVV